MRMKWLNVNKKMGFNLTTSFLTFVVVNIQVVWCREDGNEGRESSGLTFTVHPVASKVEVRKRQRACS